MTTYPTEVRATQIGIVLALYPSDLSASLQIQRAPDSGGSPDTGNAVIVGLVGPGTRTFTDLRGSGTWWYRIRHVRPGATPSDWLDWVSATSVPIPAELPQLPTVGGWVIKQGRLESTDGNIVLDAPDEQIRIGPSVTDATTGVGIFFGLDGGTYQGRIGDPNGKQLYYDGDTLLYSGDVQTLHLNTAFSGTLTGTTAETTLRTITVPADRLGATGGLTLKASILLGGTNAGKTIRVRFDGDVIATEAYGTGAILVAVNLTMLNRTTASQLTFREFVADPGGPGFGTQGTTVDTTADCDITITCQLANASDAAGLDFSLATVLAEV